jgi:hypothetical protein
MRGSIPASAPWFGKTLFQAYRVLWCIGFVLAVWTVTLAAYRNEQSTVESTQAYHAIGVEVKLINSRGQIVGPFQNAAVRAGLKDGDVLVSVDGHLLPADHAEVLSLISGPDGKSVALGLHHADGSQQVAHVVRSREYSAEAYRGSGLTFSLRRWIVFCANSAASLLMLFAALLLFFRQPHNRIAGLMVSAIVLNELSVQALYSAAPAWIDIVKWSLGQIMLTYAVLIFPEGHLKSNWHRIALLVFSITSATWLINYFYSKFLNFSYQMLLLSAILLLFAIAVGYRRTNFRYSRKLGICSHIIFNWLVCSAKCFFPRDRAMDPANRPVYWCAGRPLVRRRPARRAPALPPVRCRIGDQSLGRLRRSHTRYRRSVRGIGEGD